MSEPAFTPGVYGEPWRVSAYVTGSTPITLAGILDTGQSQIGTGIRKRNADRIVAAVNACRALADPERDLAEMVAILRDLLRTAPGGRPGRRPWALQERARLLLSRLGKEGT